VGQIGGLRQGDIVLAATPGDYGKPRPWLVVQTDTYNVAERPGSVLVCPLTTHDAPAPYRVPLEVPCEQGSRLSWIMVDKVVAIRKDRARLTLHRVGPDTMAAVRAALRALLGL
jgi:mRNA interferase MazF